MSTAEHTSTQAVKARRLTRSRVLWGMIGLCLVLWGITAIHHAMQPKYQGKTAEEWFEQYSLEDVGWQNRSQRKAFQHFGTNALWFLWREFCRKDSPPTAWIMAQKDRLLGYDSYWGPNAHEKKRQAGALFLLGERGADAEPLIPEILSKLRSKNPDEATSMARLLGNIQRQPELVVPAIRLSLLSTNLDMEQRISHYISLAKFGNRASSSLPELQARLANPVYTNSGENLYLATAILQINGPGSELGLFTNNLVPGNFVKSFSSISLLQRCGTNAFPAVPVLIHFAQTLTNESESKSVMETIHKIDPEGLYHKP